MEPISLQFLPDHNNAVNVIRYSGRAYASPTDRGVARILLFIVPVIMWFIVFPLLGVNVNVRIGG